MPVEGSMRVAKAEIYRRFPEMDGIEPSLEERAVPARNMPGEAESEPAAEKVYVLTFRKEVVAQDGTTLTQVVRATVDGEGNIVKVVASR